MKYKILLENWNRFLSKDLISEAKIMKQKDAIAALSEIERYQEDADDFFLSTEMIKDPAKWKILSKYMNILVQEEVPDDEKFLLSQKLQICYLHGESIFPNLEQEEQNDLLEGYYSVWELEEELGEIIELKGLKKSVGGYFAQKSDDAEILYRDENLVVVKPLTTVGSIVWGRGMSDGSRERDAENGGRDVDWCTTVSGNNLFNGYIKDSKSGKEKNRLYYIIKDKSIFRGEDAYRKICIGITSVRDKVTIDFGNNMTVDADNVDILTKKDIVAKSIEEILQLMVQKICSQTPELINSFNNATQACLQDSQTVEDFQERALGFNYDRKSFVEELGDLLKVEGVPQEIDIIDLKVFDTTYDLFIDFISNCKDVHDKKRIIEYYLSPNILSLLDEYEIEEEISARISVINKIFDGRIDTNELAIAENFIKLLSNFIETFRDIYFNEILPPEDPLFVEADKTYNMIKRANFSNKVSDELGVEFEEIDKEIDNVKKGLAYDEHEWQL